MNEGKMRQEAWSLYREYSQAEQPDAAQIFMAEEALSWLVLVERDPFERGVHRYNLAGLYEEINRFDLAEKQLLLKLDDDPDEMTRTELARLYLYGDASMRDAHKAYSLLESSRPGIERNLLLLEARLRMEEQMEVHEAIELIEPIMESAQNNREYHPLWAAEAQYRAHEIDLVFSNRSRAIERIEDALDDLMLASPRDRMHPLHRHISQRILRAADALGVE